MSALGDLLELLHDASTRCRTVRAAGQTWHDPDRARAAAKAAGRAPRGVAGTPGAAAGTPPAAAGDRRPPQRVSAWRLLFERPDKARLERYLPGGAGSPLVIADDGVVRVALRPGEPPALIADRRQRPAAPQLPIGPLLDPSVLLGAFRFEVTGRETVAGRPAIAATAVRIPGRPLHHTGLPPGAGELTLLVDAELGVLLRLVCASEGEVFEVQQVREIAVDEPIPAASFEIDPSVIAQARAAQPPSPAQRPKGPRPAAPKPAAPDGAAPQEAAPDGAAPEPTVAEPAARQAAARQRPPRRPAAGAPAAPAAAPASQTPPSAQAAKVTEPEARATGTAPSEAPTAEAEAPQPAEPKPGEAKPAEPKPVEVGADAVPAGAAPAGAEPAAAEPAAVGTGPAGGEAEAEPAAAKPVEGEAQAEAKPAEPAVSEPGPAKPERAEPERAEGEAVGTSAEPAAAKPAEPARTEGAQPDGARPEPARAEPGRPKPAGARRDPAMAAADGEAKLQPVSLEEAVRRAGFPLLVPRKMPDVPKMRVLLDTSASGPAVRLHYRFGTPARYLRLDERPAGAAPAPAVPFERRTHRGQDLDVWEGREGARSVRIERAGTSVRLDAELDLDVLLDVAVSLVPLRPVRPAGRPGA